MKRAQAPKKRFHKGFQHTASLLSARIRSASESRGFAVSRLLTHWSEIVGADIAKIARPIEITYGRGGLGATLSVLTTGAQAPMLEMQKEKLREKVNGCYGYSAISRVRITQTAPTGFADGAIELGPTHHVRSRPEPEPKTRAAAKSVAAPVKDERLRQALEALGTNVLTRKPS
jgi:hypothetical protein